MNDSFAESLDWDLTWPEIEAIQTVNMLYFCKGKLVCDPKKNWSEYSWSEGALELKNCLFVSKIQDQYWYCTELTEKAVPDSWIEFGLRDLAESDAKIFALVSRASQLLRWQTGHMYCGHCGSNTITGETEHVMVCSKCSVLYYPKLTPCVIVLIHRKSDILLARNIRYKDSPMYSLIAGFIEVGETVEQAVHREVQEEIGVSVRNIRYQASQTWPFPSQLMLGFYAEYEDGEIDIQEDEILTADWFPLNKLPLTPPTLSIAGWMIEQFKAENKD